MRNIMKVYVVVWADNMGDTNVLGVYTNQEIAESICKDRIGRKMFIRVLDAEEEW